jgi:flagellar motor switch protein FliM
MSETIAPEARPSTLVRQHDEPTEYPGLDDIGRKMSRIFADLLAATGANAAVGASTSSVIALGEWREHNKGPIVVARFRVDPFNSHVSLSIPQSFLTRLVDCFFGGHGEADPGRRPLSASEESYFVRIARALEELMPSAWVSHANLSMALVEQNGAQTDGVSGADAARMVVQAFPVTLEHGAKGHIDLVYPSSLLTGMPTLAATAVQEDAPPPADAVWQARLQDAVLQAHFPMRAVFARIELPLAQLLILKAGDVLPICLPKQVPVTVAGRHFAMATVGEASGRTAIKIERMEKGPNR